MKTILKNTIRMVAALFLATSAPAVVFTNLYNFSAYTNGSNSDGAQPAASMTLSGGTLYGTTSVGGVSGLGTVFRINTDGTGFTALHLFSQFSGASTSTNSDGNASFTVLALSGNVLYGAGPDGGSAGAGVVFRLKTDGTGFTNLHSFTGNISPSNTDGANPFVGLALSGGTLFGTTVDGGTGGQGTVFAINTDGSGFTNVYNFSPIYTNTYDDARVNPESVLLMSGGMLYGTIELGGGAGFGALFRVNTDGTGYTNLYSFQNFNESGPHGRLVLSGGTLYGVTHQTVFKVTIDGTGFTNIHSFDPLVGNTNSDGASPVGDLVLSGSTLYGTTQNGSSTGGGTVFKVNTDGTSFTTLYAFSAYVNDPLLGPTNGDGYSPRGGLVLSGGTLYGTTSSCGYFRSGTIFALTVFPTLQIQLNGSAAVLSWNDPAFSLQAAPTAGGTFTNVTGAVCPYTNTITGSQQFFRLQAN